MKKSSLARRVPRKIGDDSEEPSASSESGEQSSGMSNSCTALTASFLTRSPSHRSTLTPTITEPTLKRPIAKPRKGSSLRTAFTPSGVEDEAQEASGVVTPKRSNLSRIAIQRNASQQSSRLGSVLHARQTEDDEDGPSYSAASLQALKHSTPTTPQDLMTDASNSEVEDVSTSTQALDLSSKFGDSLARYQQPSAIPSAAEIVEKKARRARLAMQQNADEYISLNPSDPELDDDEDDNSMGDDSGRLILKPKDKYNQAESRLVRDDEDIMENFDEFTEADGKILIGRKAEKEAARRRKAEMAAQIAEAEDASGSDSDTSERERNHAFEVAQTKHGTFGANKTSDDPYAASRPKTPPKITPLPTLDGVIERVRKQVADMQTCRMQKMHEMEALKREKIRLSEEEVRIQRALTDTAEKFAQLRAEKGIGGPSAKQDTPDVDASSLIPGAGAGLGFARAGGGIGDAGNINGGRSGLGFGMAERGLESIGTSAVGTPAGGESEDSSSVNSHTLAT